MVEGRGRETTEWVGNRKWLFNGRKYIRHNKYLSPVLFKIIFMALRLSALSSYTGSADMESDACCRIEMIWWRSVFQRTGWLICRIPGTGYGVFSTVFSLYAYCRRLDAVAGCCNMSNHLIMVCPADMISMLRWCPVKQTVHPTDYSRRFVKTMREDSWKLRDCKIQMKF